MPNLAMPSRYWGLVPKRVTRWRAAISQRVEELAAVDVPADAPAAFVAALGEVLPAGGDRVEVGDLVGGVHIAGSGPKMQGEGVVVDRHAAEVAADECHDRTAPALPVQEQKIGHDIPRVSRYQSRARANTLVSSTTWPSR